MFVRQEEDLCDVGAADTDRPDPDQDLPECPASHYCSPHRAGLCKLRNNQAGFVPPKTCGQSTTAGLSGDGRSRGGESHRPLRVVATG